MYFRSRLWPKRLVLVFLFDFLLFGSAIALDVSSFSGVDRTGATDSFVGIQNAINAALARSETLYWPCGAYKIGKALAAVIPSGKELRFQGAGKDCVELWSSGAHHGFVATFTDNSSSFSISEMTVSTDFSLTPNPYYGISLTKNSNINGALSAQNSFERVAFRGHDGRSFSQEYWGAAVAIHNVNNVNFMGGEFYGSRGTKGYGVYLDGTATTVVFNFTNSYFVKLDRSIHYGAEVQGVTVTNSNMTAVNHGVYVPASAAGVLSQLTITGGQCAPNPGGDCVYGGTAVDPVNISNQLCLPPDAADTYCYNFPIFSHVNLNHNTLWSGGATNTVAINLGTNNGGASSVVGNIIFRFKQGLVVGPSAYAIDILNNTFTATALPLTNNSTVAAYVNFRGNSGVNVNSVGLTFKPTLSGFCGSPRVTNADDDSLNFLVNVGPTCAGYTGTVVFPIAAPAYWNCTATNLTRPGALIQQQKVSATAATFQNFSAPGAPALWTASDVLAFRCARI